MDTNAFHVAVHRSSDHVFVAVCGELDLMTAPILDTALFEASLGPSADVLIDFTDVSFFDGQAIGVLDVATRRLEPVQRHLTLCGLNAWQRRIIGICGLQEKFGVDRPASSGRAMTLAEFRQDPAAPDPCREPVLAGAVTPLSRLGSQQARTWATRCG